MSQSSDPQSNDRLRRDIKYDEPTSVDYEGSSGMHSNHRVMSHERSNSMTDMQRRSFITYNHITYLLYVVSYFTAGLLWVVPIVMNYAKRHDARGTWLATHFDWQIKTFWYSIVWFAIGLVIILFALSGLGLSMMLGDGSNIAMGSVLMTGFGLMILVFTLIWHFYRIVRGWIALTDNRPVP